MRVLVLLMLTLFLPAAAAGPGSPVGGSHDVTAPDDACGDCVGASANLYTTEPAGCNDCATLGVVAAAGHDGDAFYGSVQACRGGFVTICVVDIDERVPA